MDLAGALVLFGLLWWLVLFMVLPIGVRSPEEADEEAPPGTMPGAPARQRIWLKFLITTLIACALWGVVYGLVESGLVDVRALFES